VATLAERGWNATQRWREPRPATAELQPRSPSAAGTRRGRGEGAVSDRTYSKRLIFGVSTKLNPRGQRPRLQLRCAARAVR
jgi:hypothetical protein